MSDLQKYFNKCADRPASLAKRIGVSPSTITRLLSGERGISAKLAIKIERGTDGKVKAKSLLFESLVKASNEAAA